MRKTFIVVAAMLAVVTCLAPQSLAEEVEKKLRFGLALGQINTRQNVPSDAANILVLTDATGAGVEFFEDPRSDNAALGVLSIRPAWRGTASLSYAFNRFWILEGSIGYQTGNVGDIEIQAEFFGQEIPSTERNLFRVYNVDAGTMTQVPIQATVLCRFRPKAKFNPYLGAGAGYTFVGFSPSDSLDQISANMGLAVGRQTALSPFPGGYAGIGEARPLQGVAIEADDYLEWHVAGGAELSVARKWVLFLDARYQWTSSKFFIGFNGYDSVGISVPSRRADQASAFAYSTYGPYEISSGGLIDAGRIIPKRNAPPDTNCAISPGNCTFVPVPDGRADPGFYYARGGSIDYGGVSIQLGFRVTF